MAFVSANARAQAPSADALFDEGKRLFEAGSYKEACEKFEASQKLDAAVGTQFNLAECWQKIGLYAKARELYLDVVRIAHAAGKGETEKRAADRLSALETIMPRVVVRSAATPPESIAIDGVVRTPADLATGVWLDPGEHKLEAKSTGKLPFKTTFTLAKSELSSVNVPELANDPSLAPPPAPPPPRVEDKNEGSTQRTLAYAAFGVGAAGIVVGSVFGILSLGKNRDASKECPEPARCDDSPSYDDWVAARELGNVSTVAFIVGGAFAVTGAALWFTAPSSRTNVGLNASGLTMRHAW